MAPRKPARGQLALSFDAPPAEKGAGDGPAPWPGYPGPRPLEHRRAGLMEALKRDLATLAGPPEYVCDRAFYEERVAGYRQMLSES